MPIPSRFFPALLLLLVGILFFFNLSGRDLWEPNEPIAAQAAREMTERRDWLLPTVNGELYPDKPPLLFWGIQLASRPFGRVTETTARIPSALAGAALVLALYFLTRRTLGERGAAFSAATLAVSNLFVEQARYAQHDMLLCLGVTVGILALHRVADGEAPRAGWIALAAAALAFGTFGKGPIALGLPALMVAAETLLDPRIFRRWGYLILAGAMALVPPAVYYAGLARRHGTDLLANFLFHHNVDRFVAGFDHGHPWWFYLARAPIDLLPASLFLPAAALVRPEDPARRRLHRRLWTWIGVPLLFFSLSASKRPVYVLPVLPAVALLCGSTLDALLKGEESSRSGRRSFAAGEIAALAFLAAGGLAAPLLAYRRDPDLLPAAWLLAILTTAGSAFGGFRLARGPLHAAPGALIGPLAEVWLVAIGWIYPAANRINSPRFFAEEINRRVPAGTPLRAFGLYRFRSGYLFYANRKMPRLETQAELERYLESGERVFCVLPGAMFRSLKEAGNPSVHLVAEGRAGQRKDCLISNRPPEATDRPVSRSPGKAPAFPGPAARSENEF